MDEIELPLVDSATMLSKAVEVMKTEQRSGLVTIISDRLAVVELDQVVEELRERGDGPLSGLSPNKRTGMFTPNEVGKVVLGVGGRPPVPRQSFIDREPLPGAEAFRSVEPAHLALDYVVQAGQGGTLIRIITRHEPLKRALEALPVLCACADGHQYTKAQTEARKNKCTKCLDGKRIDCDGGS